MLFVLFKERVNDMKNEKKSSIALFIVSSIFIILLTIRVGINYELKGIVKVYFIIVVVLEIIGIVGNGIKIFRKHK